MAEKPFVAAYPSMVILELLREAWVTHGRASGTRITVERLTALSAA